jgi:hypothetical protein
MEATSHDSAVVHRLLSPKALDFELCSSALSISLGRQNFLSAYLINQVFSF